MTRWRGRHVRRTGNLRASRVFRDSIALMWRNFRTYGLLIFGAALFSGSMIHQLDWLIAAFVAAIEGTNFVGASAVEHERLFVLLLAFELFVDIVLLKAALSYAVYRHINGDRVVLRELLAFRDIEYWRRTSRIVLVSIVCAMVPLGILSVGVLLLSVIVVVALETDNIPVAIGFGILVVIFTIRFTLRCVVKYYVVIPIVIIEEGSLRSSFARAKYLISGERSFVSRIVITIIVMAVFFLLSMAMWSWVLEDISMEGSIRTKFMHLSAMLTAALFSAVDAIASTVCYEMLKKQSDGVYSNLE